MDGLVDMKLRGAALAIRYLVRVPLRAIRSEWRRLRVLSNGLWLGSSVIIDQDPGCKITSGLGSSVGTGSILLAKSCGTLVSHIVLGDRVIINEYNNLRAAGGDIRIGNHCLIAEYCTIVASNHTIETNSYIIDAPWDTSKGAIEIGDDVWIGANCVILPGIKIGRGAVIGAGSIVTKDVPAFSICVGNPARVLRRRILHA